MTRRPPALLALLVAFAPALARGQVPSSPPCPVLRVVDGEALVVLLNGNPTEIRLIGVDAPEPARPRKEAGGPGREASAYLHQLLDGRTVRLEWEPGLVLDRRKRTFAYVVLEPEGLAVNRELVALGYARVAVRPSFGRLEDFLAAEREAQDAGLGLWGQAPLPSRRRQAPRRPSPTPGGERPAADAGAPPR